MITRGLWFCGLWLALCVPGLAGDEPVEDVWAVRCASYSGENRVRLADNCAEHLRQVDGLKSKLVRVFHERDESLVFYGRYNKRLTDQTNESEFKPDPSRDLELIRSLSMEAGGHGRPPVWPFRMAAMDTLPVSSAIPSAWELENAPGDYSLQVAVFYDTQDMHKRRAAAEAYCKLLRAQGDEAYINHGQTHSIVCVGAFPKSALRSFQHEDPMTGRVRVTQRIVDPKMLAAQKRHPFHLQNGAKMLQISHDKAGNKIRDAHVSFPVEIPSRDPFAGLNP
jgi:hypothetical protein